MNFIIVDVGCRFDDCLVLGASNLIWMFHKFIIQLGWQISNKGYRNTNDRHRFQVRKSAEQAHRTGSKCEYCHTANI